MPAVSVSRCVLSLGLWLLPGALSAQSAPPSPPPSATPQAAAADAGAHADKPKAHRKAPPDASKPARPVAKAPGNGSKTEQQSGASHGPHASAAPAAAGPIEPAPQPKPVAAPAPAVPPLAAVPKDSCTLEDREQPRGGRLDVLGSNFGLSPLVRIAGTPVRMLERRPDRVSVQVPADSNGGEITLLRDGKASVCGTLVIIGKNR
jgi:hypothetical protein